METIASLQMHRSHHRYTVLAMSSLLIAGGTTKAATSRSWFALALRAWNLCVLLAVIAALLLVSPAAVVILLPVACIAISLYLLCAIAARLLVAFVPPDRARDEARSGVRERKEQDCVEVDRAEAPGGSDDDASSAEEGQGEGTEQEHGLGFSSSSCGEELSDPCDDEQRLFYFVDTGSYYGTFYDLLAFWRSMEREEGLATGGESENKCSIHKAKYIGCKV
ncbi:hypothetical protein BAE44_0012034 [Dichanthelium oligosanthes]|uniref:Uncharacterized protein n=1 Tax=Dichanthelium oligosanthes TaxID=888268 RepID=A0A1E5VPE7_9POAL|nr:hypothetical protein BAE44_0012034 [Dichanthelium oligosanthes]